MMLFPISLFAIYTKGRGREIMASLKYNPSLLLILILCPFALHVHSQSSNSCDSPLNLTNPFLFDTSSLHCVVVWSDQNFVLRYVQASANVWSFVLSAPNPNSYVAMAFSPDGKMVRSSAVVGWVAADSTLNMRRYYLGGQSPDAVTLVDSSDNRLQVSNSSIQLGGNQMIYMAFQVTSDKPTSHLLYSFGPPGRLPAAPSYALVEHQQRIATSLNYATGQFATETTPEASLRRSHGILNMLGWGILMPIGVMVARYMRQWDPIWFYSHVAIQSTGFVLGVIGIICGFVLQNRLKTPVKKHKGIGVFILVLGCLQVIAFLARPDKTSKVRKYWNWYHFIVGRVLIFAAAVNVFYGIHLAKAGAGWNAGFASVLVIFFIITLILELRACMRK
ncbi:cytochrome b561 and DOMON domain-containing protein At3g07570-like [Henckelia pumila]|uniref:cytochrome b561 and DOMON domain-containing protein At3g07570-like n=1 Tax=Henckelia pumila TaxID=405737 RepID=UPI003C6E4BF6